MRKEIVTTTVDYGGFVVRNWNLKLTSKSGQSKYFYLGQDAKVCARLLGMRPADVVIEIKGNCLSDPKVNARLANLVVEATGLTARALMKLKPWEIAVE